MSLDNSSIFVPEKKVQEYCNEHDLSYDVLKNGILILSASKKNPEAVYSSIDFRFSSGSYFDLPEKKGSHHLLEHLINLPIRDSAIHRDVNLNASTSYYDLIEHASGPVTDRIKDYGLLSMLPQIYSRIENPFIMDVDVSKVILSEKKIVKTEIDERNANHGWLLYYALLGHLLQNSNPLLSPILGTDETLDKITADDLEKISAQLFSSKNLTITIVNDGKKELAQLVKNNVTELFQNYPQKKFPPRKLNWQALDQIKKQISTKDVLFHKTPLQNGICSVVFSWIVDFKEYTTEESGLKHYLHFLNEKVHKYSRQKGIAYSAGAYSIYGNTKQYVCIRFDISKKTSPELKKLLEHLKTDLLHLLEFSAAEIKSIIEIEQKRQRVIPLNNETRLNWMVYGIQRYNKVIDADIIKERYKHIQERDIKQWEELFIQKSPQIFVIGDLAET